MTRTIHCDIYIMERGMKRPVGSAVVEKVPEGMDEVKAAHFILSKASEHLPHLKVGNHISHFHK